MAGPTVQTSSFPVSGTNYSQIGPYTGEFSHINYTSTGAASINLLSSGTNAGVNVNIYRAVLSSSTANTVTIGSSTGGVLGPIQVTTTPVILNFDGNPWWGSSAQGLPLNATFGVATGTIDLFYKSG